MKIENSSRPAFEDKILEIDHEISKRKNKWQLSALSYMDFDDVSQILRAHIFNKWQQYDPSRPLAQWLNTIISNRIKNIVRDNYSNLSPPCNGCSFNLGDNHCSNTKSGEKCEECPLYKSWCMKKRDGYHLKLASSIDAENFCENSIEKGNSEQIDYEKSSSNLHESMKAKLSSAEWKIYEMLFIFGMSEKEVSDKLNLKTKETGRLPGYRHLFRMKAKFITIAKKVLEEEDIIW